MNLEMMQSHKAKSLVNVSHFEAPVQLSPRGRTVQDERIPQVPHLPDGYQHGHTKPILGGLHSHPVRLDNDHTAGKGDQTPKLTQFLARTNSNKGQVKAIIRVDNVAEQTSSGNESASSLGKSNHTHAKSSLPTLSPSSQPSLLSKSKSIDQLLESYDLNAPVEEGNRLESLEIISELLFSGEHLKTIFADPSSLLRFTLFLGTYRPRSVPTLIYYLDATKALKAIGYANAIASGLEPISGQGLTPIATRTVNSELEEKAEHAFNLLVQNDLPAYTTHIYIQVIKASRSRPATETNGPHAQESSDGFAEVFCLTDPSRQDNPIVFASEAFHQMTQYSMNYIVGRNCRFLQGPHTKSSSIQRIREAVKAGREHCEVILNYRRDGSPFMNLLMHAPLYDDLGRIRYFLGAQIDVSHVVDDSPELESLKRSMMRMQSQSGSRGTTSIDQEESKGDEFQQLIETLDMQELKAVRSWEGRMLQQYPQDERDLGRTNLRRPGVLVREFSSDPLRGGRHTGHEKGTLDSLYSNYLLVRPYPSLRILFASPSLSIPEILQAPIMDKIGGSARIRDGLTQALAEGREVTAKVRWLSHTDHEGQNRWIHFTPLVGNKGQVGVWMAVLEEDNPENIPRMKPVPPEKVNGMVSPIPEEPHSAEQVYRSPGHKQQISWSGPEIASEDRRPSLNWSQETPTSPFSEFNMDVLPSEIGDDYESLEERLKKKRARDAAIMNGEPGLQPIRQTYKSLAPAAFLDSD